MAATRKKGVPQQVIAEDLDQMKNLFGGATKKIETVATPEFDVVPEPVVEEVHLNIQDSNIQSAKEPDTNVITEEKREVSDTTVGIRMTTAKKREMKAYFIQHGTTMSQGVIDAFALLKMLEDEGKVAYRDGILERV